MLETLCQRPHNCLAENVQMSRFDDFVERCDRCQGLGQYTKIRCQNALSMSTYQGPCEVCRGIGGKITEQGIELERFLCFL